MIMVIIICDYHPHIFVIIITAYHTLWKFHQVTDGSSQGGCGGTLVADNWVKGFCLERTSLAFHDNIFSFSVLNKTWKLGGHCCSLFLRQLQQPGGDKDKDDNVDADNADEDKNADKERYDDNDVGELMCCSQSPQLTEQWRWQRFYLRDDDNETMMINDDNGNNDNIVYIR